MSEQLQIEDFSKQLNTKFKVYYSDEQVYEAELIEVLELRNDDVLKTFSTIFLLPLEFGFEQRLYKIEHAELGTMELFIVPVGQNEKGIRFEALFNHLVRK